LVQARIGIIGGSGIYSLEGLEIVEEVDVPTPFGAMSDSVVIGRYGSRSVAFLPRHGKGHRIQPTDINYRANIYGLKTLGVEWLVTLSAAGSLKEGFAPLHMVVPDQFIDFTKRRVSTFFGDDMVAHISMADPACPVLAGLMADAAEAAGATVHRGGTYVCIEGPQFSTRAESFMFRQWGAEVIGMTAMPEAKLAREADMCYATMAMITDYDVWHEQDVTQEMVINNMKKNIIVAKEMLRNLLPRIPEERTCECPGILGGALVTDPAVVPPESRRARAALFKD